LLSLQDLDRHDRNFRAAPRSCAALLPPPGISRLARLFGVASFELG
jgi:hypothetical protein